MKKTDPNNLRRPAVNLFARLLPENIFSGVWTFGKWVNMLVPHGIADSDWKTVVHTQAPKINSAGLFTNIEEALRRATWDWKEYDSQYERTIIILSDGVVDISDDPKKNNDSRTKILEDILVTLSNARVTIHTIALSSLSDKDLLQQLSSATGGIHETIETTTDLDKTFMRIFDVATPRDELPLVDNKVKVDKSIKEITFLIFRQNTTTNTVIISPSGKQYHHGENTDNVTFHSENRYDLVTIKSPETGTWQIDASTDPDNRVMVVTDMTLVTQKLPGNILAGDTIPFYAHLESEQKTIQRRDFLHFVRMVIKHSDETKSTQYSITLKDDGKGIDEHKKDGVYSGEIKKTIVPGQHMLELLVNGTTFKRRNRQKVNIVKYPAIIDIALTSHNEIAVSSIPYPDLINTKSLKITAIHSHSGKNRKKYTLKKTSPAKWKTVIPTKNLQGTHSVTVKITGRNQYGKVINISTNTKNIVIGNNAPETVETRPEKIVTENQSDITENKTTGWMNIILSLLGFNITFFVLAFFTYKLWIKYKYTLLPPPCEELTNA